MSMLDDEEESLGNILVVDDEVAIQALLQDWLEPYGFKVVIASNGAEALELAPKVSPDAIIMDASMPVLSGFDTLVQMKRSSELFDIPVIMLTVHNNVRDIVNALDAGATDYIQKPFNPQVLIARLRAAIRSRKYFAMNNFQNSISMIIIDNDGIIISSNDSACKSLGKKRNELQGLSITSIWPWLEYTNWNKSLEFDKTYIKVALNTDKKTLTDCHISAISLDNGWAISFIKK